MVTITDSMMMIIMKTITAIYVPTTTITMTSHTSIIAITYISTYHSTLYLYLHINLGTKIMSVEERATGDVTWEIYSYYIRAGGLVLFSVVVFCLLATQAAGIVGKFGNQSCDVIVNKYSFLL